MTALASTAHGRVELRSIGGDAAQAARVLRSAGAHAVLVPGAPAWLETDHARGPVHAAADLDPQLLAQRWTAWMQAGFVAADAALLALGADGGLPSFGWDDGFAPAITARRPAEGLYAIVDSAQRVRQVFEAGITLAQVRIKQPADADVQWFASLRQQLREAIAAARGMGATLYVNDHWRAAAEVGADAVHLGQEDLAQLGAAGRAELAASGLALGVSSHSVWELCRARALSPSYVACGPVWPTTTKDMPWRAQGLDNLGWWVAQAGRPVVAIGGILEPAQVRLAAAAGAGAVCLVRGLGPDPRRTLPAFQAAFEQGRAERRPAPAVPHPSLEPRP